MSLVLDKETGRKKEKKKAFFIEDFSNFIYIHFKQYLYSAGESADVSRVERGNRCQQRVERGNRCQQRVERGNRCALQKSQKTPVDTTFRGDVCIMCTFNHKIRSLSLSLACSHVNILECHLPKQPVFSFTTNPCG